MSCPPRRCDRHNKTIQQHVINRIRPRSKGKDRSTEAQQDAPGAAASVRVAQTARFYPRTGSRSGTLLTCLRSLSCCRQPPFPYDRYPPPFQFPCMPSVTDLRCTPPVLSFASSSCETRSTGNEAKKQCIDTFFVVFGLMPVSSSSSPCCSVRAAVICSSSAPIICIPSCSRADLLPWHPSELLFRLFRLLFLIFLIFRPGFLRCVFVPGS